MRSALALLLSLIVVTAAFAEGPRCDVSVTLTDGIAPISIASGSYEGKANPHAWMGLDNALVYIDNIERALSEQDPGNAETYRSNAAS